MFHETCSNEDSLHEGCRWKLCMLERDIKDLAKACKLCQHLQWYHFIHGFGQLHQKQINFDFARQFLGKMLLIIDKWPYTVEMMTTTSKKKQRSFANYFPCMACLKNFYQTLSYSSPQTVMKINFPPSFPSCLPSLLSLTHVIIIVGSMLSH